MAGQRVKRGVYRVKPDGPNDEVTLFVVDSRGFRVRTLCDLLPVEVDFGIAMLRGWLDEYDPVGASQHRRRQRPLRAI